jgi:rhodanese-related sulfurtransferase/sugar lactone lactonase YvrE
MTSEKPKNLFTARLLLIFGVFLLAGVIYIAAVALRGPVSGTGGSAGVDPDLLVAFQLDTDVLTLIDARSPEEYLASSIPGAINVPYDAVETNASLLPDDKKKPVVVHCKTGKRAGLLKKQLDAMGYTDVQVLPSAQIRWGEDGPVGLNLGSAPYRVETLVGGGPLHGAKGIAFGPDGFLYVCSVYAQSIFRVNVDTGEVTTAVPAPDGESDDVAFAPDGTMAWTALPSGEIRARRPGGEVFVVASGLPLINPVRFTADGRLFAAQIGVDRFLEIDIDANQPPRLIAKGIGHLNSFVITDDDQLYGPLAGIDTVARIDIETGAVTPVAENVGTVSAVKMNSRGELFAVGWSSGELMRIDIDTGAVEVVTTLDPPLDNLAIGPDDTVYVSQPARGAIVGVDPVTGQQADVVRGKISVPGGLAMTTRQGRETLVMADDFGFRLVDAQSGEVSAITDLADFMDPASATDVAVNDEVIVASDVTRSRVYMVARDSGKTLYKWKGIDAPYGLVLLDSGDPIVADFANGRLIRLSTQDRKSRDIVADGLSGPVGVAWAGPSALYVTEATGGRVTRIDMNDGSKVTIRDGLIQPEGLAVLPDGRVAVVEAGARRLTVIDPQTGATEVLASDLPVGLVMPKTPAPVHVPSGVAVGANGILYLTSDRDHSVIKLIPAN